MQENLGKWSRRAHRKVRTRTHLARTSDRPRLSVARSLKHISAQILDLRSGRTLLSVTTTSKALAGDAGGKSKTERAKVVGREIARRALEQGIKDVVFDRGCYRFHGRVKALADAAREAGLKF
jgi:large subunit ribosomal protein L18